MTQGTLFEPTEEQRRMVKAMAGYGVPQTDIATLLEVDAKTLRKHFRRELVIVSRARSARARAISSMSSSSDIRSGDCAETTSSCFSRHPARAFIQKIAAATLPPSVAMRNKLCPTLAVASIDPRSVQHPPTTVGRC